MENQLNYDYEKKKYLDNLKNLEDLLNLGAKLSNKILEDIPITKERELAEGTFLFSKILLHLGAILNLLPESSFLNTYRGLQFWDISSIAVLTRALIETYLAFYYISVDDISKGQRELRLSVWDYNSYKNRVRGLKSINPQNPELKRLKTEYQEQWDNIRGKLGKIISSNKLKNIKEARTFFLWDRYEILKKVGIPKNYIKTAYNYLSQYVHATSFAMEQMRFKPKDAEILVIFNVLMGHNIVFTTYGIRDFVKIFPDLESLLTQEFKGIQDSVKDVLSGFDS